MYTGHLDKNKRVVPTEQVLTSISDNANTPRIGLDKINDPEAATGFFKEDEQSGGHFSRQ
jgi:hypothetical protein